MYKTELKPVIRAEEIYDRIVAVTSEEQRKHWQSNLYCQVTTETTKIVNLYEYKKVVKIFIDNTSHTKWYSIPFVYPGFGGTYDAE